MITASRRATATWARSLPRRRATSTPQRFSQLQRCTRVSSTLAASAEQRAHHPVAALADAAVAVGLPRGILPRRQAEVGADKLTTWRSGRVLHRRAEGQRRHRTDAGHAHQQPADRIRLHRRQHQPMQFVEALKDLPADPEDGTDHLFEELVAIDELAHTLARSALGPPCRPSGQRP